MCVNHLWKCVISTESIEEFTTALTAAALWLKCLTERETHFLKFRKRKWESQKQAQRSASLALRRKCKTGRRGWGDNWQCYKDAKKASRKPTQCCDICLNDIQTDGWLLIRLNILRAIWFQIFDIYAVKAEEFLSMNSKLILFLPLKTWIKKSYQIYEFSQAILWISSPCTQDKIWHRLNQIYLIFSYFALV